MSDRPIIFSGPMVLSLLSGRKTMTRRLAWRYLDGAKGGALDALDPLTWPSAEHPNGQRKRPSPWQRRQVGDRLWVRENICVVSDGLEYACDGKQLAETEVEWSERAADVWNRYAHDDGPDLHSTTIPSIFCPRWASRITLAVTAVKVERLQDISYDDCRDEGTVCPIHREVSHTACSGLRRGFRALWTQLHGPNAWEENPHVVALSFTVARRNIGETVDV